MQTLTLVLVGAFVAGLLFVLVRSERARARLARLARRRKLNYMAADSHDLRGRLQRVSLFRQGHNRYLFDVVSGSSRLGPVYCFHYRYERGFGIDRRTHRWTVAAMELEKPIEDLFIQHPHLPDGHLSTSELCRRDAGSGGNFGSNTAEPTGTEDARSWLQSLDLPAALECRDRLITLQAVDDGSDTQYERMLEAIQQLGVRATGDRPISVKVKADG